MGFLPNDYKEPVTSNYMKLEDGDNIIRILGSFQDKTACMGMEYWKQNGDKKKPVRYEKGLPAPLNELEEYDDYGNLKMPTFFWALPVYNVKGEKVQIVQIIQKTIRQGIETITNNPKWGDPKEYNIVITKTKEGGKTSYTVISEPKEKLDPQVLNQYKSLHIDWEAFMRSEDPFKKDNGEKEAEEKFSSQQIADDAAEAI